MTIEELFRAVESYLTASIEMTSGRRVTVSKRNGNSLQALAPCVWWKQTFTIAKSGGALVLGVADPFWTRLFASDVGDQATMKESLFEAFSQTALRILDDVQQSIGVTVTPVNSGECRAPADAGESRASVNSGESRAPEDAGEFRASAEADGCVRRLYAQCDELPAAGDLIIVIDRQLMDRLLMDRPGDRRHHDRATGGQDNHESLVKLGAALTNEGHDTGSIAARLLDLPLPVSIRIAQTSIPIKDVLRLTPGSVVELGKHAGEPVEIVVHGAVLAKGEVVSVKGYYGVRVTEIVAVSQRLAAVSASDPTERVRPATVVCA